MNAILRFSIRHPWWVFAITIIATLGVAPGIFRLKIRTDGHALVPKDASEILLDRTIRDSFGIADPVVILIRTKHERGVFNKQTVALVADLTADLMAAKIVAPHHILSLATEKGYRVKPGTLKFRAFLEPLPQTNQELDTLRDDLDKIQLYNGTIVSFDKTATAIMVGIPPERDRMALFHSVLDVIDDRRPFEDDVTLIGAPVAEGLLGTHILEDLGVPSRVLGHPSTTEDDSAGRMPHTLYELRVWVARHIGLVPVALALMAFVFLLAFRSWVAAMLPLAEVGACLLFVFGVMGWCDTPLYLTTAVLPVILTAIGVADEIHIFARYQELLREYGVDRHVEALTATMSEMWVPVVKTSVTTAVGFLSFALSPIAPVRAFGLYTALGIVFCMLFSLATIPAVLGRIAPRRFVGARRKAVVEERHRVTLIERFGHLVQRGRYVVIAGAFAVVVAACYGVPRVVVQDSWIDGFAPQSEFHKAATFFNEQFLGMHTLLVRVDMDRPAAIRGTVAFSAIEHNQITIPADGIADPQSLVGRFLFLRRPNGVPDAELPSSRRFRDHWDSRIESVKKEGAQIVLSPSRKDGSAKLTMKPRRDEHIEYDIKSQWFMRPDVLRRLKKLELFLADQKAFAVGGVVGPARYIETTNYMVRRREDARVIPDRTERVEWLWGQYGRVRTPERLRQIVNEDYTRSIIGVLMKNANFVDTARLMDTIRGYEQTELAKNETELQFAGDVAVSQALIKAIVRTQVLSLIGSLVGIVLITSLLGKSLRWGLACVLPCALAVFVNFAVMGYTSMPLGVATSMFSGMTLGIGVDFAIHFLERYRRSCARGLDRAAALNDTIRATGPAIFIDAIAVGVGFGILTLSQVPANARLGFLVVLSIAGCLAATMILLPALLSLGRDRGHRIDNAVSLAEVVVGSDGDRELGDG